MPKKLKGRTLWDFSTSILLQNSKKIEGGPFRGEIFFKESRTVPKKSEAWTFWSRPVLYVTRETFLIQFLGPTGTFWGFLNFVELLVELFWSVQVVLKKTLTKSHDYSRLFS